MRRFLLKGWEPEELSFGSLQRWLGSDGPADFSCNDPSRSLLPHSQRLSSRFHEKEHAAYFRPGSDREGVVELWSQVWSADWSGKRQAQRRSAESHLSSVHWMRLAGIFKLKIMANEKVVFADHATVSRCLWVQRKSALRCAGPPLLLPLWHLPLQQPQGEGGHEVGQGDPEPLVLHQLKAAKPVPQPDVLQAHRLKSYFPNCLH